MKILKALFEIVKFLFYLFIFIGALCTVLVGGFALLAHFSDPTSMLMFNPETNTGFVAFMLIPTGMAAMLYLADKAMEGARMQRFDWELFEEGKRMTKTVRNPLLDIHEETTVICDIYRRPTGKGDFEYKTVERYKNK